MSANGPTREPIEDDEAILFVQEEDEPDLSADTSIQTTQIERSIDDLPQEVQARLAHVHAELVRKELTSKLKQYLKQFFDKLTDPSLDSFQDAIRSSLKEEDKLLFDAFKVSNSRKDMSYENVSRVYQALQASIKQNIANPQQANHKALMNIAGSSLASVQHLVNYNIPELMNTAKKITVMQETRFVRKNKKKSFFRKVVEAVFPFIQKREDSVIIKKRTEKISSLEKAAVQIATTSMIDYFAKYGEGYFNAFDNAIEYNKQVAKGYAMNIIQTTEQANVQVAMAKASESTTQQVLNIVGTAAQVIASVDKGINEWIVAKLNKTTPGAYLEHVLQPGSEVRQTTITEHFRNEFEMASQKEAFNGLIHFARHLTNFYITSNRAKQNGYSNVSTEQFGFKNLDDLKFEVFLSRLIRSLGFPVTNFNDLQHFMLSTEDPNRLLEKNYPNNKVHQAEKERLILSQKEAFERFVRAKPNDAELGIRAAVTWISDEHAQMMPSKGNENYFYCLNLQKEVLEVLQEKERKQNAVSLASREFTLEERVYHPGATSVVSKITGQLKNQLVQRMPELVGVFLSDARQLQDNANTQYDSMLQNWLKQIGDKQQAGIDADQAPVIRGLSVTELSHRWEKSASKTVKKAFRSDEVKRVLDKFNSSAVIEWKNSTISLLQLCIKLEGPTFLSKVIKQLETLANELKNNGAHETTQAVIFQQITAIRMLLSPDGQSLDKEGLLRTQPEALKIVFDGVTNAIEGMEKNSQLTIDERQNLYMMSQALGTMNTAFQSFDWAKKAYDTVYKTHFDKFNSMPEMQLGKFVAEYLGRELEKSLVSSMNAPIVQFQFYAKQKMAGLHRLSEPKAEETASAQNWSEWGESYISSAIEFLKPAAVKLAELGAAPFLLGYSSYYMVKLYQRDIAPDPRSINQAVCDNAKMFIREKTYEAIAKMIPQMYMLFAMDDRFQKNHKNLLFDAFAQCGLSSRKRYYDLMDNLAKGLGHESIEKYIDFQRMVDVQQAIVDKAKTDVAATWMYSDVLQQKVTAAEQDLQVLRGIQESKRKEYAALPQSQEQLDTDKFVTMKEVIQNEYLQLTEDIKKGNLDDGTNYLVMLSSLNAFIQQVELVQRETIAIELLSPDIDAQISYNSEQQGVLAQLKLAAREELKEVAQGQMQKGIFAQLTQSMDTASYFSTQLMDSIQQQLTTALNAAYVRPPAVASAFSLSRRSADTVAPKTSATNAATIEPGTDESSNTRRSEP